MPTCRELEPREGVDRHGVRLDAAHVAEGHLRVSYLEERAHPLAEPGQVSTGDGAPDRERDGAWPRRKHLEKRTKSSRKNHRERER